MVPVPGYRRWVDLLPAREMPARRPDLQPDLVPPYVRRRWRWVAWSVTMIVSPSRTRRAAAGPVMMAVGGNLCTACHGRGGWDKDQARWEPCSRCGGKGGKKSGKVWVPCSGCNGAGGRHRNAVTLVKCGVCNGTGFK